MATPLVLAQLNNDLTYTNSGAGGTGTPTGAVRYRDGHTGGVSAALVEEGTTNYWTTPGTGSTVTALSAVTFGVVAVDATTSDEGTHSTKVTSSASNNQSGGFHDIVTTPWNDGLAHTFTLQASMKATQSGWRWYDLFNRLTGGIPTILPVPTGASFTRYAWTFSKGTGNITTPVRLILDWPVFDGSVKTAWIDRMQWEEKNHATTFCPEFSSGTTLRPGYAWTGAEHNSTSTRAAAKVEIPCTAPASVAFRYREAETGAMTFAYITTLTGNNAGTYGKISHNGTNLVIESDRLLVIGPVFAFSTTLSPAEQATLSGTTTWTFDLVNDPPPATPTPSGASGRNRRAQKVAIISGVM